MNLQDLLLLLMAAGSGGLVFWLMENVKFLAGLSPEYKRYTSLLLSGLIPVAAWLIGVLMAYWAPPETWRGWIEAIFAVACGGVLTSQALHGALRLANWPDEQAALMTDAYERGESRCGCAKDKQP